MLPGKHHMGTTRMHTIPHKGVVDENCLVHGVNNLYIAGSSVFPTSGMANPTLTIVALAIRLAERVKQVMAAGS
jgi:choline dehydrogenase-like flavoprotein